MPLPSQLIFLVKQLADLAIILFVVRLWARCSRLFGDSTDPTGRWSSYAISLVFLHFCQQQSLIGPMEACGIEPIDGWNVRYNVNQHQRTDFHPTRLLLVGLP